MLKCIAIDDEPLALRQLQGYIAKINFLKLEKAFTNAIEAQQYLAGNPIDLIFVDINMPDLSGVEFVRSLVSRPMIIRGCRQYVSAVRVGLADLQCAVGVRRSDTERRSGEVSESGHAV